MEVCGGCKGRRAAGSTVHGMIHAPSKFLSNFLGWRNSNITLEKEQEAAFCKTHHARLVGGGGKVFPHTEPNPCLRIVAYLEKRRLKRNPTLRLRTTLKVTPLSSWIGRHSVRSSPIRIGLLVPRIRFGLENIELLFYFRSEKHVPLLRYDLTEPYVALRI